MGRVFIEEECNALFIGNSHNIRSVAKFITSGSSVMKTVVRSILAFCFSLTLLSCHSNKDEAKMIEKHMFGTLADGQEAFLYTLVNKSGMQATITNYGAAVTSLLVPDRTGKLEDVVLGYDSLIGYVKDKAYFGAIVGRYGNRIAKGRFRLDGKQYQLTINDGENHLHGGAHGFNKALWRAEPMQTDSTQSLKLTYTSPDGEDGYPGNVTVQVVYTLNDNNELVIDYTGTTDRPTILNPTHHSYFNLSGSFTKTILDDRLMINADYFTPVDKELIPIGELAKVDNTPMDFRRPTAVGARINDSFEQLRFGKGYDHNWVINNYDGAVREAATLFDSASGRFMEVWTDQPGLQFYSGNFLDGTIKGKKNTVYNHRTGLCLEAQHFPDSPNKPDFPSVVLRPGMTYKQETIYKFGVK
jgi:aldose 1-epimerase